jgi:hypothetical protein
MVSPVRRREAVEMVEDRLEVSQRRACSTLGQHRSTQRYRPHRRDPRRPIDKTNIPSTPTAAK